MTDRIRKVPLSKLDESERLYHEILDALYERADVPRARKIAIQIDKMLATREDVRQSIRGDELRSLTAEARGDSATAIRHREGEIRKIFELHSMAINKPGWDYVLECYGYDDLSDRLDILASLYADHGDLDRAAEVIEESRRFCSAHGIPFDGEDVAQEIDQMRKASTPARRRARAKSA
jgi:hypothetical protein